MLIKLRCLFVQALLYLYFLSLHGGLSRPVLTLRGQSSSSWLTPLGWIASLPFGAPTGDGGGGGGDEEGDGNGATAVVGIVFWNMCSVAAVRGAKAALFPKPKAENVGLF